ncbi:hypothetical protein EVAR_100934_1 [Eumeta japonica]|uniref:Uncharacterized protein n=1 Tax=Eumeta variegata TaxID=151549 RepID=A0A4C1ZWZ9_EUMVA|nr:hypothetical protein EVAR_100934_1 [Eumeta japonica]
MRKLFFSPGWLVGLRGSSLHANSQVESGGLCFDKTTPLVNCSNRSVHRFGIRSNLWRGDGEPFPPFHILATAIVMIVKASKSARVRLSTNCPVIFSQQSRICPFYFGLCEP